MVRFLARTALTIIANALGLIVAAAVLDDMALSASAFFVDVVVFTVVIVLIQPLIVQTAIKHASALMGSSALLASFVALVVTAWLSDGMKIDGSLTWLLATVIVWGVALLAGVVLPLFLFKRVLQEARA